MEVPRVGAHVGTFAKESLSIVLATDKYLDHALSFQIHTVHNLLPVNKSKNFFKCFLPLMILALSRKISSSDAANKATCWISS